MKKHDANIKKGKLINFQIGIIAIISFCYVMYEVSHYSPIAKKRIAAVEIEHIYEEPMGPIIVETEPIIVAPEIIKPEIIKPVKIKVEPTTKVEEVDNTTKIETTEENVTPTEETKPEKQPIKETVVSSTVKTPVTSTTKGAVHNEKSVDMLPVFPGCDKYSSNDERAVCFQEKIQRMITRKFDRSIGNDIDASGKQYISLYFEIDENGKVSNIKARSQYPEFITEAKRVAKLLPEMEPAQRKGKKVKMSYNIPIVFRTDN